MIDFKDTKIYAIGNLLKSNPNKIYTVKDISLSLKIKSSTVTSSFSKLSKGRIVGKTKTGKPKRKGYKGFDLRKFKRDGRGKYFYKSKVAFKAWKVWFKLIETNTIQPMNNWVTKSMAAKTKGRKAMDLSAYATGIAPSNISKSRVVEIAADKLFFKSLDVAKKEGLFLFDSLTEESNIFKGGKIENENPLDTNYDSRWTGEIHFVNAYGTNYDWKISYNVEVSEY